jgi:hypothetical protein
MTATASRAIPGDKSVTRRHHWHGLGQTLDSAVHRGNVAEAVEWETFIVEHGEPEDRAWLTLLYRQLRVPRPYRRVEEPSVKVMRAAQSARREHLAQVRSNDEAGLVALGWKILPGDPPPDDDRGEEQQQ